MQSHQAAVPWYRELTSEDRRTLVASALGYTLDAMDFLLLAVVISVIIPYFHVSFAVAGLLSSASLIASAAGGYLFGVLTDYFGRARVMMITVLVYSVASLGAATSQTWVQLLFWRVLLGLGMGGEWASGMALLIEKWGPGNRGKASGLIQASWPVGYFLAVVASLLVVPRFGWRGLFVVGVLPALLIFWMRRNVPEPERWRRVRASERISPAELFSGPMLGRTVLLACLTVAGLWGYEAYSIWAPTFLQGRAAAGGAGLAFPQALHYLFLFNGIGIVMYAAFGFLADRYGRRGPSVAFALLSAVFGAVFAYSGTDRSLLVLGVAGVGAFTAFFSVYGAWIGELFPTRVRGWALGFLFNTGRVVGGFAPILIGKLAPSMGLGHAMAVGIPGLVLFALVALALPETRGVELA
jgi:MFS family permease